MNHSALVSVVESHGAKGALNHHLPKTNIAGLESNIRDSMDRHPW
jgi:hypothetical protein